jgi:hypothetical protein
MPVLWDEPDPMFHMKWPTNNTVGIDDNRSGRLPQSQEIPNLHVMKQRPCSGSFRRWPTKMPQRGQTSRHYRRRHSAFHPIWRRINHLFALACMGHAPPQSWLARQTPAGDRLARAGCDSAQSPRTGTDKDRHYFSSMLLHMCLIPRPQARREQLAHVVGPKGRLVGWLRISAWLDQGVLGDHAPDSPEIASLFPKSDRSR